MSKQQNVVSDSDNSVASLLARLYSHLAWADTLAAGEVRSMRFASSERRHAETIYAHLAAAEHSWLARIVGSEAKHSLWPALALDDAHALAQATATEFAERIGTPGWIDGTVTYANSTGARFTNRVTDILAHVALHGSYHRGQLALLARQDASAPAVTEYIAFLRAADAAPRGV